MKSRIISSALITVFAVAGSSLNAATITTMSTAPAIDGEDIANLDLTNAFEHFQSSFLWQDRPARGQTFTTGSDPSGYTLDAITIQTDRDATGTREFSLRIGSILGTTFTPLVMETATSNTDLSKNDFLTFLLDTSLFLAPDTVYGFDMAITSATPDLYKTVGMAPVNNSQTDYSAGTAYSSGGHAVGGPIIDGHDQDRIFHLNLASNATVPEPASAAIWTMLGLGIAAFGYCRTRPRN